MIEKLETLEDLYFEELRDLYDAETQLIKALPRMAEIATSPNLRKVLLNDYELTRVHQRQLEQLFERAGRDPAGHECKGMSGLLEEQADLVLEQPEPRVLDAGLVVFAQKAQHYEMAGYGRARTFAIISVTRWPRS